MSFMLSRELVNKSIQELPEVFSIDELIERLIFIEKVEEGLKQSEEGQVISHETLKENIKHWSK